MFDPQKCFVYFFRNFVEMTLLQQRLTFGGSISDYDRYITLLASVVLIPLESAAVSPPEAAARSEPVPHCSETQTPSGAAFSEQLQAPPVPNVELSRRS